MAILGYIIGVIVVLLYLALVAAVFVRTEWFLAIGAILTGDRQVLRDCNLCDKPLEPQHKWQYRGKL